MSLRSLSYSKRNAAADEIIRQKGFQPNRSYLGTTSVYADGKHIGSVKVSPFGRGKPTVQFKSEKYRPIMEEIGKELKSAGSYLFPVKVESHTSYLKRYHSPSARFWRNFKENLPIVKMSLGAFILLGVLCAAPLIDIFSTDPRIGKKLTEVIESVKCADKDTAKPFRIKVNKMFFGEVDYEINVHVGEKTDPTMRGIVYEFFVAGGEHAVNIEKTLPPCK